MPKRIPRSAIALFLVIASILWVIQFGKRLENRKITIIQCIAICGDIARQLSEKDIINASVKVDEIDVEELLNNIGPDQNGFERDEEGRLVDVWGTPFLVTLTREERTLDIHVRSAGRDRKMHTADDWLLSKGLIIPEQYGSSPEK